ncbi:MAG: NAD(P)-dependent oxidoreductase [Candidatus Thermoplasmatota archaeon]|nr:NAD(P)-dependent oxidoreductase [Candidatus Thermoplasmatota archaeon]MCL5731471.1 NAD(P)-dependent oxidoreductase [Candidatus Thermoplasmatota archaeon]
MPYQSDKDNPIKMVIKDYKIGFIGLGRMGREILPKINDRYRVHFVYNRSPEKYRYIDKLDTETAESPEEISKNCNLIFLSLTDTEAVKSVIFGKSGLISNLRGGTVIIDMSTISHKGSTEINEEIVKSGAHYMDCPVIGSVAAARNSSLTMVCGGDKSILEGLKPVFSTFCSKIFLMGPHGNGLKMKLINNIVMGLNMISAAIGVSLGGSAGFSPETVSEILLSGGASSKILDLKRDKIVRGDFSPEFSLEHQLKDIRYGIELMNNFALELKLVEDAENLFASACTEGFCSLDESAIYQYLRRLASVER